MSGELFPRRSLTVNDGTTIVAEDRALMGGRDADAACPAIGPYRKDPGSTGRLGLVIRRSASSLPRCRKLHMIGGRLVLAKARLGQGRVSEEGSPERGKALGG